MILRAFRLCSWASSSAYATTTICKSGSRINAHTGVHTAIN
jgi:hypothetical protein